MRRSRTCLLIGSALALSGCMLTGGMGGMSGMSRPPAGDRTAVIGRSESASARIMLEFPAVAAPQDVTFTIQVEDGTGAPVSGALVMVQLRDEAGDDTAMIVKAIESRPGVYKASRHIGRSGVYTATAEVTIDDGDARSVMTVAVQQDVRSVTNKPDRRWPLLPVAVVGTAAMAAMMVLMIAR